MKKNQETSNTENFWNTKNKKKFVETKTKIKYDDWQWKYIEATGDTAARIGRQSGKSEGEAARLGLFALEYICKRKGLHLLITGGVERQAYELYQKVVRFLQAVAPTAIKGRPTMRKMELTTGLTILSLPCGRDGAGLRNYTIIKLAIDEAHYVHDDVYIALRPMLLTTGGTMDLMSTTRGDKGEFREAFREGSGFTTFHFKTRDVYEKRVICESWTEEQRTFALDFINKEQKRMTKNQFKQEYEAEFLDSLQQFFPAKLYDSCVGKQERGGNTNLGVDLAGYGGDENAFVTVNTPKSITYIKEIETSERVAAWETVNKIVWLNTQHNYVSIGVDDGGLGTPILDYLLTKSSLKRKTVGLNNASRVIDKDRNIKGMNETQRRRKLLKEDMYGNLKMMMEQGLIKFEDQHELRESMLSIQFEIDEVTGNVKIHGKYAHITEAFIRAVYLVKSKGLNIWSIDNNNIVTTY